MIKKVEYKENGSIDFDNTELLKTRADIDYEKKESLGADSSSLPGRTPGVSRLRDERLGGLMKEGGEEEKQLKTDLKRTGWKEARKATDVKHTCPVCGTRYWGRPNKDYCSTPCKEVAKKRRQRKRKRDIRDFKPHRGKSGEVYFMYDNKDKNGITFVPAFNADSRARAKSYIDDNYPEDVRDDYYKQVKEVIRK